MLAACSWRPDVAPGALKCLQRTYSISHQVGAASSSGPSPRATYHHNECNKELKERIDLKMNHSSDDNGFLRAVIKYFNDDFDHFRPPATAERIQEGKPSLRGRI